MTGSFVQILFPEQRRVVRPSALEAGCHCLVCAPQITRSLEWDALHVDLGQTFVGYSYATTGGPALRTAAGIGTGSTVNELRTAYGSKFVLEEGIEASQFQISLPNGSLDGYVDGSEGNDTVESLNAGTVCGE